MWDTVQRQRDTCQSDQRDIKYLDGDTADVLFVTQTCSSYLLSLGGEWAGEQLLGISSRLLNLLGSPGAPDHELLQQNTELHSTYALNAPKEAPSCELTGFSPRIDRVFPSATSKQYYPLLGGASHLVGGISREGEGLMGKWMAYLKAVF